MTKQNGTFTITEQRRIATEEQPCNGQQKINTGRDGGVFTRFTYTNVFHNQVDYLKVYLIV